MQILGSTFLFVITFLLTVLSIYVGTQTRSNNDEARDRSTSEGFEVNQHVLNYMCRVD